MTKQLLKNTLTVGSKIRDDISEDGRWTIQNQIAFSKMLAEIEGYLNEVKTPKTSKVPTRIKNISGWLTLINKFMFSKGVTPVLHSVHIKDGNIHVTNLDTHTILKVGLPENIDTHIGKDEFKALSELRINDLGDWEVKSTWELEVKDMESEYSTMQNMGDTFDSLQNAQEYFDNMYGSVECKKTIWEAGVARMETIKKWEHEIREDQRLIVKTDNRSFDIPGMGIDEAEYPTMEGRMKDAELMWSMDISLSQLQDMASVGLAASTDENRPVFQQVLMKVNENGYVLAAADGFRLVVDKTYEFQETFGQEDFDLLLPADGLVKVTATMKKLGQDVIALSVYKKGDRHLYKFESALVTHTGLMEQGEFPDYSRIIPNKQEDSTVMEVGEGFEEIMKDVVKTLGNEVKSVKFCMDEKDGVDCVFGSSMFILPLKVVEAGIEECFAINPQYVADIIKVVQPTTVWLNSKTSPIMFEDGSRIGVIMPQHVNQR